MASTIRWEKKMHERAKARGVALFAYGMDCKAGRGQVHSYINHEDAMKLWFFAMEMRAGAPPRDAFAKAFGPPAEKGGVGDGG